MRVLLTILVAAAAAFGARSLALARNASAADAQDPTLAQSAAGRELLAGIAALRAENQRLERELERRSEVLSMPQPVHDELGENEIAAALARWRAANPQAEQAAAEERARIASRPSAATLEIAAIPMEELVRVLSRAGLADSDRQHLFQQLRDSGRIDEYLAAIEALVAADPENAALQVALGHAYLQKLFGMGQSPDVGTIAMKSDQAFDRALEIDEENWEARFSKAVSLSNWPAFLGRGPEAIEHFEILLEQQEELPARPEFAMTYLFLGNMQQASGNHEAALATWKAGLALYPDAHELRAACELAESR